MGKSELLKGIIQKEKYREGTKSEKLKKLRESYTLGGMAKGVVKKAWGGIQGVMRKLRGKK
jgi:hypothetical protein